MAKRQNRGERLAQEHENRERVCQIIGLSDGIELALILGYWRQARELERRLGDEESRWADAIERNSKRYKVWK